MSEGKRPGEPFWVEMNLHVPGKGYSLSVHTDHVEMQVYVSEKGRVVKAYAPRLKNDYRPAPTPTSSLDA